MRRSYRLNQLSFLPVFSCLIVTACASSGPTLEREPATDPVTINPELAVLHTKVSDLEIELVNEEERVETLQGRADGLQVVVDSLQTQLALNMEKSTLLQTELQGALEEFATGQCLPAPWETKDILLTEIQTVRERLSAVSSAAGANTLPLEWATSFLGKAKMALEAESFGAAKYLSDRADSLIDRAAEPPSSTFEPVNAIVPPQRMEVTTDSNLRAGPATTFQALTVAKKGTKVNALARSRNWLLVETESGLKAWIHGDLAQ